MTLRETLFRKFLITITALTITRIGSYIPVSNIESTYIYSLMSSLPLLRNNLLITNINLGIFTLNIFPYLNASILIQVLTRLNPKLKNIQKEEGERGQKKINLLIRTLTLLIAIIQSIIITFSLKNGMFEWSFNTCSDIVLSLVTGSMIMLWLSEIITEKGICNGTTILLITNILTSLPISIVQRNNGNVSIYQRVIILIFLTAIIYTIDATITKIPLITARQLTIAPLKNLNTIVYLPLKMNQAGIMPIVFTTICLNILISLSSSLLINIKIINIITNILNFILVIIFSNIYANLTLDSRDIANNLNKNSVAIPNITPGIKTKEFIERKNNHLANIGGLFLATISSIPNINTITIIGIPSLMIVIGGLVEMNNRIKTINISKIYGLNLKDNKIK